MPVQEKIEKKLGCRVLHILSYRCQVFELLCREASDIFSISVDPFEIIWAMMTWQDTADWSNSQHFRISESIFHIYKMDKIYWWKGTANPAGKCPSPSYIFCSILPRNGIRKRKSGAAHKAGLGPRGEGLGEVMVASGQSSQFCLSERGPWTRPSNRLI